MLKVGKHFFRVVNMVQGWETLFKVGKHGLSVVNMAQGWFVLLKVSSWFKVG